MIKRSYFFMVKCEDKIASGMISARSLFPAVHEIYRDLAAAIIRDYGEEAILTKFERVK